jgi:putative ABC transport system permease protein
MYLAMINRTLLSVLAFAILGFIMITFLMIIKNRKVLVLKDLWGYSKRHLLVVDFSEVFKYITFIMGIGLLTLLIIIKKYNQIFYMKKYIIYFLFGNFLIILIMISFIYLECLLVKKLSNSPLSIKSKLPFEKLYFLSIIFKIIIYIIMFFIILSTSYNLMYLNLELNDLERWDKAKDVYRITEANISNYKLNDLTYERDLNDRSYEFYKEINKNNEGFLIESGNFSYTYDGNNVNYFYKLNATGEEEICSPSGRCLTIDKGYLKVNPIVGVLDKPIEELMVDDEYVLNILVPKKYQKYEEKIKKYISLVKLSNRYLPNNYRIYIRLF